MATTQKVIAEEGRGASCLKFQLELKSFGKVPSNAVTAPTDKKELQADIE